MELYHHGIKGQKWGVRRFQNKDGTLTEAGKKRARLDDVNTVFRSLSGEDKRLFGMDKSDKAVYSKNDISSYENLGKAFVKKVDDKPVAFLLIDKPNKYSYENGYGNVAIATDPKYRGKGYSNELIKKGQEWVEKYGNGEYKGLEWWAYNTNAPSNALAQKNGFKKKKTKWDDEFSYYQKDL